MPIWMQMLLPIISLLIGAWISNKYQIDKEKREIKDSRDKALTEILFRMHDLDLFDDESVEIDFEDFEKLRNVFSTNCSFLEVAYRKRFLDFDLRVKTYEHHLNSQTFANDYVEEKERRELSSIYTKLENDIKTDILSEKKAL